MLGTLHLYDHNDELTKLKIKMFYCVIPEYISLLYVVFYEIVTARYYDGSAPFLTHTIAILFPLHSGTLHEYHSDASTHMCVVTSQFLLFEVTQYQNISKILMYLQINSGNAFVRVTCS